MGDQFLDFCDSGGVDLDFYLPTKVVEFRQKLDFRSVDDYFLDSAFYLWGNKSEGFYLWGDGGNLWLFLTNYY